MKRTFAYAAFTASLLIASCSIEKAQEPIKGLDGEDGYNSIIDLEETEEGVYFYTGLDLNRNGTLEQDEITKQAFIRHGVDGVDGEDGEDGVDGEDGKDGYNYIASVTKIIESEECPYGGQLLSTGLDLNRNNVLDENEVTSETSICNPECECEPICEIEYIHKEVYIDCFDAIKLTFTLPNGDKKSTIICLED